MSSITSFFAFSIAKIVNTKCPHKCAIKIGNGYPSLSVPISIRRPTPKISTTVFYAYGFNGTYKKPKPFKNPILVSRGTIPNMARPQ